ncbi:MAG: sialate O-acetylesterase [Fimbriimonas sp.]
MIPIFALSLMTQTPLTMPRIFSDHMVLQRQQPIPFFGTATPGKTITVKLESQFSTTTVRPDGTWNLKLRPREAGGPYTLEVSGDGYLRYEDVMVGEVWFASGQSNMEMSIGQQNDIDKARAEANPNLRMFTIARRAPEKPAGDVDGFWMPATSESAVFFSAVGYWFGNDLRKWLNVPVGIIHASWGGTPAEAWTRRESLLENGSLAYLVKDYLANLKDYPQRRAVYEKQLAEYKQRAFAKDTGNEGAMQGFPHPTYSLHGWKPVKLPNLIEVTQNDQMDGAVWFRRTVDIPAEWAGKTLVVELGTIDDFDDTYFNGHRIGGIDSSREYWYAVPRRYVVSPALLRSANNSISVRVFDQSGTGGFTGAIDTMRIYPADGTGKAIPLAGTWLSKVERRIAPRDPATIGVEPDRPYGPGHPWSPGSLWNGMVSPVVPYGIRGAIWYQGESNADRAHEYRELFPALIRDWRRAWNQGDFPFYFVQLANYTAPSAQPEDSTWAELRESQAAALRLPNTGMAVAIDLGEANDIHPKGKLEVGRRLALQALAKTYGIDVAPRGPFYRDMQIAGDTVRVRFENAKGLKTFDGSPVEGFAIAGDDRKFYWAQAKIEGETVVLRAPEVPRPVAIRYAWANNPATNLYNSSSLPLEPFRTDDWPGITEGKRKR